MLFMLFYLIMYSEDRGEKMGFNELIKKYEIESRSFAWWFTQIIFLVIGILLLLPFINEMTYSWSYWRVVLGLFIVGYILNRIMLRFKWYQKICFSRWG